jgi:nuclear protein localization family protein 4
MLTLHQLLRIRSPAGTARVTVEPTTSGEDLTRMMLETVVKSGDRPDESTIRLSNQPPGPNSQQLELSALIGRTVSDMGFR